MPALETLIETRWTSGPEPDVLSEIGCEAVNLAIWERRFIQALEPALTFLLPAENSVRIDSSEVDAGHLTRELLAHCPGASGTVVHSLKALAEDWAALAQRFADLTGRKHLRLRFERVEDDGCALFHVDTLPIRLLCTYAGPGTQWVEEEDVRRNQLGLMGRSITEANAAIVPVPDTIRTVPAWHVLIFKGRPWEGHGYSDGLVHRSAPVRYSKDHRLRLTIDFSDSCNC